MRKVLLTVLLGLSLSTIGQTKRIALFNKEFGGIRIVQQKVEVTDNVSSVVLMLSFQNQLYQHVSDFKVISINKKEDVEKLISNFESALSFSKSKEDSIIEFEDKENKYNITVVGKASQISLRNIDIASGLIVISNKDVTKIIEALKGLKENYGL